MNRYLLIDYKENVIHSIQKVEYDFEVNETQTSSVACIDRLDMLKEIKFQIDEEIKRELERIEEEEKINALIDLVKDYQKVKHNDYVENIEKYNKILMDFIKNEKKENTCYIYDVISLIKSYDDYIKEEEKGAI